MKCPICAQYSRGDECGCGFKRPIHPIQRVRATLQARIDSLRRSIYELKKKKPDPAILGLPMRHAETIAELTEQICGIEFAMTVINENFGEDY